MRIPQGKRVLTVLFLMPWGAVRHPDFGNAETRYRVGEEGSCTCYVVYLFVERHLLHEFGGAGLVGLGNDNLCPGAKRCQAQKENQDGDSFHINRSLLG